MNAADKATNFASAAKIAAAVNLFQREFNGVKANLRPWASDPQTIAQADPDSIDIGFNLPPGRTLVQMRFADDRLIGVDATCFGLFGNQRWKFSTVADWRFFGPNIPFEGFSAKFRLVCRELFDAFNSDRDIDIHEAS